MSTRSPLLLLAGLLATADGRKAFALPDVAGMMDGAGYDELRRRFAAADGTVAVVGSSGNLLYRGYGPEIDAQGAVIRINGAVTLGYTDAVGHGGDSGSDDAGRRSIRVCWDHGWYDATRMYHFGDKRTRLAGEHEMVVRTSPTGKDTWFDTGTHPAVTMHGRWASDVVHHRILGRAGSFPSTGFLALCIAVAVARSLTAEGRPTIVHAYGFGGCAPCGKYYDVRVPRVESPASAELSLTSSPFLARTPVQRKELDRRRRRRQPREPATRRHALPRHPHESTRTQLRPYGRGL